MRRRSYSPSPPLLLAVKTKGGGEVGLLSNACYSTSGCSVRVEKRLQACGVRVLGGEEGAGVGRAGVRVEKSVQVCGIWRAAGLRLREPRRVAAGGGERKT
jgi:hypothetical protein